MNNKSALGIFFRIPEYGKVKKRLAAQIGEDEAFKAYAAMLYETITNVSRLKGIDIYGFYDGSVSSQGNLLKGFPCIPQQGKDLGERMLNALNWLSGAGYEKTILIGADSPDLPLSFITEAFERLNFHDFVIGPSIDGGFYLIGMNKPIGSVFKDMKWGHADVLKEIIFRADAAGISYFFLPKWYDIDDLESLKRWKDLTLS